MSAAPTPDPDSSPAPDVDPRLMRDVLGHFASGITVITAVTQDRPIGFTCQSFSSLSLDPPLVLFAPGRSSRTWPLLRALGAFCVNVLADEQADLSQAFARSGVDKFAGVEWAPSPAGHPRLSGVAAWLDCGLHAEHDGGDHTIVTARVLDLGADETRTPLLYHRGSYTRSAPIAD